MFQIFVFDKKFKEKNKHYVLETFFWMQWLGTTKYTIFLILLSFQNLWHLTNVFTQKNYENVHLNVFYDFQSSMGPRKSRCDIPIGTT
jgi:hypothetical protein